MRIIECNQYDEIWWESRRGVPSASEFGSIITPAKGEFSKASVGYAHQLIADTFDGNYGVVSEFATAAMRTGTIMEPAARRFYEFERSCDVQQVGFCLTDDGRFGCSPDALVGDDGLLELKSPNPKTQVAYLLAGGLPAEYKPQVHGQLIVTGRAWADFMSFVPGFPELLVRVYPDDYTEKLRAALDEFWPLYQGMLAKIRADREDAIDAAIDRKGDQLPDSLRGLVPADAQFEAQPF